MKKRLFKDLLLFIVFFSAFYLYGSDNDSDYMGNERIEDWQVRMELARIYEYMKKYENAEVEYRKILKFNPDLIEAKLRLSKILILVKKSKEGLNLLKNTVKENMSTKEILIASDAFMAAKRFDDSEKLYRQFLNKDKNNVKILVRLAELLSWKKEYDESLKLFEKALKIAPNNIQYRRKYAFVLSWSGRLEEAVKNLKMTLDEK